MLNPLVDFHHAQIREIQADPLYKQAKKCIECRFNRAHGVTDPHDINLKVRTDYLPFLPGFSFDHNKKFFYFNLHEYMTSGNPWPIVQHMLDLLHQKMTEDQLNLENPLDEMPVWEEWFIGAHYVSHRILNKQHYPPVEELSALAAECFVFNYRNIVQKTHP